ncbi:hypothetical protein, partial [Massilia genomosp. 1]|uniref:hypothetical protein n=1 Tax=Massilia genomosp. 1 TaxID=2609280 RepID=UPI001C9E47E6
IAATCFSQKTVVFSMLAPVSNRSSKNAEIRISQQVWGLWSAYDTLIPRSAISDMTCHPVGLLLIYAIAASIAAKSSGSREPTWTKSSAVIGILCSIKVKF